MCDLTGPKSWDRKLPALVIPRTWDRRSTVHVRRTTSTDSSWSFPVPRLSVYNLHGRSQPVRSFPSEVSKNEVQVAIVNREVPTNRRYLQMLFRTETDDLSRHLLPDHYDFREGSALGYPSTTPCGRTESGGSEGNKEVGTVGGISFKPVGYFGWHMDSKFPLRTSHYLLFNPPF